MIASDPAADENEWTISNGEYCRCLVLYIVPTVNYYMYICK